MKVNARHNGITHIKLWICDEDCMAHGSSTAFSKSSSCSINYIATVQTSTDRLVKEFELDAEIILYHSRAITITIKLV